MILPPPRSTRPDTPCPYTSLFRSALQHGYIRAAPCRMPHHGACRSALHLLVPAAEGPCVMSWLALIPEASAHAHNIDLLIGGFSLLILFLAGPVFILIFDFPIRYRWGMQGNRRQRDNVLLG